MAKPNDLTAEAIQGYGASCNTPCPYLYSSASSIAWLAGRWMRDTGRSTPQGVRMSRGYSIRVNDMLLLWQSGTVTFQRNT